ncbi:uncharacterized protein P174DRAFT_483788 [Aspergillus novofumigatus IBT 16806]|uniref:Uncharacterized protein n=1 Tax=Aspergillus novofumigatus (strain IBT 16806) TaxID=1392255 RepID=A0A2I1C7D4_ASPN1|nr:uncharacterized protein P174DRAFT_483788 [Aspergillus novofumigatus IBT 16806]PKX93550.1 hypothetical protein P174DRAFT_483788 [Aspergillus novofumigatus IBT 16806]
MTPDSPTDLKMLSAWATIGTRSTSKSLSPYQGEIRRRRDRDFDSTSTELPPERSIDELTSSTVILAKLHVATRIGAHLRLGLQSSSALLREREPHGGEFKARLDLCDHVRISVGPSKCRIPARIVVNRKFLGTSQDKTASNQPWGIVIEAALEILRLQHRLADESDVLDPSRPTGYGRLVLHEQWIGAFRDQSNEDLEFSDAETLRVTTIAEKHFEE